MNAKRVAIVGVVLATMAGEYTSAGIVVKTEGACPTYATHSSRGRAEFCTFNDDIVQVIKGKCPSKDTGYIQQSVGRQDWCMVREAKEPERAEPPAAATAPPAARSVRVEEGEPCPSLAVRKEMRGGEYCVFEASNVVSASKGECPEEYRNLELDVLGHLWCVMTTDGMPIQTCRFRTEEIRQRAARAMANGKDLSTDPMCAPGVEDLTGEWRMLVANGTDPTEVHFKNKEGKEEGAEISISPDRSRWKPYYLVGNAVLPMLDDERALGDFRVQDFAVSTIGPGVYRKVCDDSAADCGSFEVGREAVLFWRLADVERATVFWLDGLRVRHQDIVPGESVEDEDIPELND